MTTQLSYRRTGKLTLLVVLLFASWSFFSSAVNAEASPLAAKDQEQLFKIAKLNAYESLSVSVSGGRFWNTRSTPTGVQRFTTCNAKIQIRDRRPVRHLEVSNGKLEAQAITTTVKAHIAVVRYGIARGSCTKGAPLALLIKNAKLKYDNYPSLIEAIGSPVKCRPVVFDRSRSIQPCGDLF